MKPSSLNLDANTYGMRAPALLTLLTAATLGGCADSATRRSDIGGLQRSEEYLREGPVHTEQRTSEPIAALIAAEPLTWSEIRPLVAETAAPVLEEIAIDRVLRNQCAQAGITISAADIQSEERMLAERLNAAAATDPTTGNELLERLRSARSLGPRRFQALLQRNAMLRKLVAQDITVTPEQLEQARAVRHGPRYKGRVLISRTERDAAQARTQITAAADPHAAIASLASASTTTNTLYPAGVVDPISAADPSYPAALRSVISKMNPGELSPVIALDKTFAIFLLEDVLPGIPSTGNEPDLERNVRAANERVAMERRAQQALSAAGVNVLDSDLRWGWEHRR